LLLASMCIAIASLTFVTRLVPLSLAARPHSDGIVSRTTLAGDSPAHTVLFYVAMLVLAACAAALLARPPRPPAAPCDAGSLASNQGRLREGSTVEAVFAAAAIVVLAAAKIPTFGAPLADTFHEGEYLAWIDVFTRAPSFDRAFFIHGFGMQALPGLVGKALDGERVVALARMVRFAMLVGTWAGTSALVAAVSRASTRSAVWANACIVTALLLAADGVFWAVTERYAVAVWQCVLVVALLRSTGAQWRTATAVLLGASLPIAFLHDYAEALHVLLLVPLALLLLAARDTVAARHAGVTLAVSTAIACALVAWAAPSAWGAIAEQVGYWARFGARVWHLDPSSVKEWVLFWSILAVQAVVTGSLVAEARTTGMRNVVRARAVEFVLLGWSILATRTQLNRADEPHLLWAAFPCALLSVAAVARREPRARSPFLRVARACALVVTVVAAGRSAPALASPWLALERIRSARIPDAELLPPEHRDAVRALAREVSEASCFYTLTSEGSWYLAFRRAPCSRFALLVYARTDEAQREVVSALERERPSLILVRNDFWSNAIDGVPTSVSHPVVAAYIRRAYVPFASIGSQRFWRRREP
jgi:hypothetical protein